MRSNFGFQTALAAMLCLAAAGSLAAPAPPVKAAYTVVAQSRQGDTLAIARVILDGANTACPLLVRGDGSGAPVQTRARINPAPKNFPVRVCEAVINASAVVGDTEFRLPALPSKVRHLVVVGDTGCKPKDQNGCHQHSRHHWPFNRIAKSAAKSAPDLVLHMGDYNYRGTPGHIQVNGTKVQVYDAGDNTGTACCKLSGPYYGQNSPGSDTPDQWQNWWLDFFEPAADLLAAAPWVVARGNHELCSRAGPGWFFFLHPGSSLPEVGTGERVCPPATDTKPLVFDTPYRIDLPSLSVVVLDSANACDQGDLHQTHFDRQFKSIQKLVDTASPDNRVWLQSHRPLWAVKKADGTSAPGSMDPSGKYAYIDQTLQAAFAKHPLRKPLSLVVSGHMHRFQVISFEGDSRRPSQLVVGNGGVALASNHPKHGFSLPIDGMTGIGFGLKAFGYMDLRLGDAEAWTGQLLDDTGKVLASCDSAAPSAKTGVCRPED